MTFQVWQQFFRHFFYTYENVTCLGSLALPSGTMTALKQSSCAGSRGCGSTCRSKLQRQGQSEEQLLACSQNEEPLLDKLPCLYHSMDPDSWCDQASLLTRLRTVIWEEQKRIVWVEPDLW